MSVDEFLNGNTKQPLTSLVAEWVRRRKRRQMRRRLTKALGLGPRAGESRSLESLSSVSTQLEIEWYAHDVHPWDDDLPAERQEQLFAESSLTHTVAAIYRAFERFPEVDMLHIRVLEPRKPHGVLLAGTVSRAELNEAAPSVSPAMTLKMLGIRYRTIEGNLQRLE